MRSILRLSRTALQRPPGLSFCRNLRTLGLRREDPSRIWERRTALTPRAVGLLLAEQNAGGGEELRVEVESCQRRSFSDQEYAKVGATVVPVLSTEVDVILGIKEPPVVEVQALLRAGPPRSRTWMMFSHTHKGQEYNTPLLASLLSPTTGQTLIDHELLTAPSTSSDGKASLKRVAAFGWFAGAVGAGEALSLVGLALLKRGVATPLLHLPRPYTFGSLKDFKSQLRKTGDIIRSAIPSQSGSEGPVVIGVTGGGNVAHGAIEMLNELGVEWVSAQQLSGLQGMAANRVYACAVKPEDYLIPVDGGSYNREAYHSMPDTYKSVFSAKIAPYLTGLVNGVGWSSAYPRAMSNSDIADLLSKSGGKQKLVAVQDISCDKEGGLQFVNRFTTIDQHYFEGPGGMLISSIDILPSELAADASTYFSQRILPYVRRALFPNSSHGDPTGEGDTLQRACIVDDGKLTAQHAWLEPKVTAWRQQAGAELDPKAEPASSSTSRTVRRKKVLLLGSGLVAGPAVEVFAARPDIQLAIASNNLFEAQGLVRDRANVQAISLDVSDGVALSEAVSAADVVVSLLPAPMHPHVAKHCINYGRHLVTASYISPEMKALDEQAQEANVILLGECGLDPGIDSMAAMRILDRVKREGKKVSSFVSWCGGLPEFKASNVPLRYKFSWSPKAVLTAAQNDARFKLDDETIEIAGDQLLSQHFPAVDLWDGLPLEGLANRDSIPYAEKYGLGAVDGLTDLFRGTLRYQGFSRLLESFRRLGLLHSDALPSRPETWPEFLLATAGRQLGYDKPLGSGDLRSVISDLVAPDQTQEVLEALEWFSLLPTTGGAASSPLVTVPQTNPTPIDLFAQLLSQKLAYAEGERDLCLLHHSFLLSPSLSTLLTGTKKEKVTASLVHYGTSQGSAMSVTVGKTLAFAACRVLDGHVSARGVKGPYEREVWEGVLDELEGAGVVVEEKWS